MGLCLRLGGAGRGGLCTQYGYTVAFLSDLGVVIVHRTLGLYSARIVLHKFFWLLSLGVDTKQI